MSDDAIPIGSEQDRREALMLIILVATEEWQREEGYGKAEIADALVRVAATLHGRPL